MSCDCCLVENGQNIILELVTISVAFVFLVAELFANCNIYLLICDVGGIMACIFGIAALKRQLNYRMAYTAVSIAMVVAILYGILTLMILLGFAVILMNIDNLSAVFHGQESYDQKLITRDTIGLMFVFSFGYVLFGLSTSIALAVKHGRICKNARLNATRNEQGTMTVSYTPPLPKDQHLSMESYFMSPVQDHHHQIGGSPYYSPQVQPPIVVNPDYPAPDQSSQHTWDPYLASNNLQGVPSQTVNPYYAHLEQQHNEKDQPPSYDKCMSDKV